MSMKSEDVVTFIQKDLPYASFAAFEDMRSRGSLCDLKISLRNHTFQAHRVILAAVIPYFESLYVRNPEDVLEEEVARGDLDPEALEYMIRFAYTGKIDICSDNVHSLIRASNFCRLTQVFDACIDFLSTRLNNDNAIVTHSLGHELAIPSLTETSKCYILENFRDISMCADFLKLSHSCIHEIISADNLNALNEEIVFEAVLRWTMASSLERHEVLPDLLSEVRMIYLDADYLINRVALEELVRTSTACVRLLEEVKNYCLLPKDRRSFSELKTQQRKYSYLNGGIYALSYCYSSGHSMYHCDLVNNRISRNLKPKEKMHGIVHGVAVVSDKIYILHEKIIRIFHVKTQEWTVLEQPKHCNMKGTAAVPHGNMIYCFGSCSANYSNKVRCFDTKQNTWLTEGTMKSGRFNSSAASLGEHIYVTGGFWGYFLPTYMYLIGYNGGNSVERYDPTRRSSKKMASMLVPRENHFSTSIKGKIYVCGGGIGSDFINTAEVYDPHTNRWSYISSMPSPKSSFTLVSHNDKIYALEFDRGNLCFEVFDPENNRWDAGFPVRGDGFLQGKVMAAVARSAFCP